MTDRVSIRAAAGRAVALLRRTLPQSLVFGIAFRFASFAVLLPLISAAARGLLALSGRRVVANDDIAAFAASPLGAASFAVVAVLVAGVVLARLAGELVIAYGALHGRCVTWRSALSFVGRRGPAVLHLGLATLARLVLIAAPMVAAIGATYALVLGTHDINYYLTTRPPELWLAVAIAGVLVLALAALVVDRLVGWSLAVPLALFEGLAPRHALRASRERIRPGRLRALVLVAAGPVVGLLASATVVAVLVWIGGYALDAVADRLRPAALVLGAFTAIESVVLFAGTLLGSAAYTHAVAVLHESLEPAPRPKVDDGELPESTQWRIGAGRVLLIAGGLAVAAVVVALGLLSDVPSPDSVRSIAHRAGASHGPENSLAALRSAIEAGADLAEIDVQLTSDGAIAVVHDRDLMKLAGVPWRIAETPLEKLATADIGEGERLATLEEFIAAADGRIGLCVELKYYGRDEMLAPRVIEVLRREGVADTCEIMSLDVEAVRQVRELAPEIRTGYLSAVSIGDLLTLDVDFIAVAAGSASAALFAAALKRGLDVYVWTLNDADGISTAIDRGADGVITDDPQLLRRVLAERASLTAPERLLLRFGALR